MRRITENRTPLLDQQMETIKAICPGASIEFRNRYDGVNKWYLSTPGLELVKGIGLTCINSDGVTANNAVQIAYESITDQSSVFKRNNKTYHRWAGFMFEEVEKPQ